MWIEAEVFLSFEQNKAALQILSTSNFQEATN